jgi:hypothetical protein
MDSISQMDLSFSSFADSQQTVTSPRPVSLNKRKLPEEALLLLSIISGLKNPTKLTGS